MNKQKSHLRAELVQLGFEYEGNSCDKEYIHWTDKDGKSYSRIIDIIAAQAIIDAARLSEQRICGEHLSTTMSLLEEDVVHRIIKTLCKFCNIGDRAYKCHIQYEYHAVEDDEGELQYYSCKAQYVREVCRQLGINDKSTSKGDDYVKESIL